MKFGIILAAMVAPMLIAVPADAAGCLKGAAAGGVAGHFVGKGHAVLGAAAGCAYGHHRAAKAAQAQREQAKTQPTHR